MTDSTTGIAPLLVGFAAAILLLAMPGLLRSFRPGSYRGGWKVWGEVMPTVSLRAIGWFALAGLVGIAGYVLIQTATNESFGRDPFFQGVALGIGLMLTASFISTVARRYLSRDKPRDQ